MHADGGNETGQIVTIFVKQIHDGDGNETGLQVSIGPLYECN